MGLSVTGCTSLGAPGAVSAPVSYHEKARAQLQQALSGILHLLAAAASGDGASDWERPTWHLQMACNYLKLAASERSLAEADSVDAARDQLTDKFFFLQASLVCYREATGSAEGLLEGLELMAAVSSLLPADASTSELPADDFF